MTSRYAYDDTPTPWKMAQHQVLLRGSFASLLMLLSIYFGVSMRLEFAQCMVYLVTITLRRWTICQNVVFTG